MSSFLESGKMKTASRYKRGRNNILYSKIYCQCWGRFKSFSGNMALDIQANLYMIQKKPVLQY